MPSANTFDCKPLGDFVRKYLRGVSVDPFARDSEICTLTNDLNPATKAKYHMDAVQFMQTMADTGLKADVIVLDPPYSPRQISECYAAAGLKAGMKDTQNARLYAAVRNAARELCKPGTVVLSFGWNSTGMGQAFNSIEMLVVCHGGAHNDTIAIAQECP